MAAKLLDAGAQLLLVLIRLDDDRNGDPCIHPVFMGRVKVFPRVAADEVDARLAPRLPLALVAWQFIHAEGEQAAAATL